MRSKLLFVLLVVFALLLVAPMVAMAQDTGSPAPESQPITPTQAGELLLGAITAIVAGGLGGGPLSSFVVGLLKHVPALDKVSAPTLNLTVGGLLTGLYWLAAHFGYTVQFNSVSDFLLTAGPAFLALLTTMLSASSIHKAANSESVPIFGYQRTPRIPPNY